MKFPPRFAHTIILVLLASPLSTRSVEAQQASGSQSSPPLPPANVDAHRPATGIRGAVGLTAVVCTGNTACVYGKTNLEFGLTFLRSGLGLTADVQFSFPYWMLEAGPRLAWDLWLTPRFALTPSLFAGGVYFNFPADGGVAGWGASLQAALRMRFRFPYKRIGIGLRVIALNMQWLVGRERIWSSTGVTSKTTKLNGLRVECTGIEITF